MSFHLSNFKVTGTPEISEWSCDAHASVPHLSSNTSSVSQWAKTDGYALVPLPSVCISADKQNNTVCPWDILVCTVRGPQQWQDTFCCDIWMLTRPHVAWASMNVLPRCTLFKPLYHFLHVLRRWCMNMQILLFVLTNPALKYNVPYI